LYAIRLSGVLPTFCGMKCTVIAQSSAGELSGSSAHRSRAARQPPVASRPNKALFKAFVLCRFPPAMLALLRTPVSRISQNALKASASLVQARARLPIRPLPPRNGALFATTPARRAEGDPLSPSIVAMSQSPLVQKLANNPQAMEAFRAFFKVIADEGALLFLFPLCSLQRDLVLGDVLTYCGFI
jgi:hypothetical protein